MHRSLSRSGFTAGFVMVAVGALLLPVLLAVAVFPTPLYDTRELVAWGRHFPLITPVHPPIMVWVGGIVDRIAGPSGVAIVLAGQMLLAIGLIYVYAILRLVTDRAMAALIATLTASSFYVVFGPLSWALNADILQLTSWPAVLYHFLRAARNDRWLHWIMVGVWAAIAALTKYNAAVLFVAMAAAIVTLPAFRKCLRRPGPYVALLIAALLLSPHVVAAYSSGSTLAYGSRHFTGAGSLADTARRLGQLLTGYLPLLLPGAVVVAIGWWRGTMVVRSQTLTEASDEYRFIVLVNVGMLVALFGMIGVLGLEYIARYGAPFAELAVLAVAPLVTWREKWRAEGERRVAVGLGVLYGVVAVATTVAYVMFFSHSGLQEPTAQAARIILDDWRSRYDCGPAYFLGDRQTVYGIGIAAGPEADSLTLDFIPKAKWFDAGRLRAKGAVVVYTLPDVPAQFAQAFPGIALTEEKRFAVPDLRTQSGKMKEYAYRFAAPADCK